MAVYFEITGGMPAPLAMQTAEMYFSQEGNGGWLGLSHPSSMRNIVLIDNSAVAGLFRAHLQRVNARFTESRQAPGGVVIHTIEVPTRAEVAALMDAYTAQIHRMVMKVLREQPSRRPRRFRRRR